MAIVENGGGILRNVSSQIALREDYRQILRQHGCLQVCASGNMLLTNITEVLTLSRVYICTYYIVIIGIG